MKIKDWDANWFDSPYYPVLYKNRNEKEAGRFIENLLGLLRPAPNAEFLDLGCGKGRHSIYLNEKGYRVHGVDLAQHRIMEARQHETETLHFDVHDMRKDYRPDFFDYVLNLFTSFGYFQNESENRKVLHAVRKELKPGGFFVLDYLNAYTVIHSLVEKEEITSGGINFTIRRELEGETIVKKIDFTDEGDVPHHFQERVQAFSLADFNRMMSLEDLRIVHCFGDYDLSEYTPTNAKRLIIVAQNPNYQ